MKKVLVAGHICLDITPVFRERADKFFLDPGKLYAVGAADIHTGGAVANTGGAIHFFGTNVKLLAKVGADSFGDIVKEQLQKSGAECRIVTDPAVSTSYSVVIAPPGVDRIFLHCSAANDSFVSADVSDSDLQGVQLLHFGYPPLMRQMYVENGKELSDLFCRARAAGAATSLDFAAIDPCSKAGKADWQTILQNVLPYTDFFMPSVEELCYMLDQERYAKLAQGGDFCLHVCEADLQVLAIKVLDMGASFVLIKAGAKGMYYACKENPAFLQKFGLAAEEWSGKSGFVPSYRPSKVCSGTGAGDTSIAAFLCAVLRARGAEAAVRLAAAAGASCVEAYDAISGLQPLDRLEERIAGGWEQQIL